jgi:hypothetical protein
MNLSSVIHEAYSEFFTQAVVGKKFIMFQKSIMFPTGFFPVSSLLSSTRTVHEVDFLRVSCDELIKFEIPFSFRIDRTG